MKSITNNIPYSKLTIKSEFQKTYPLEKRKAEAERILKKYPDRIPVIVERANGNQSIPDIDKKKYLVLGEAETVECQF